MIITVSPNENILIPKHIKKEKEKLYLENIQVKETIN